VKQALFGIFFPGISWFFMGFDLLQPPFLPGKFFPFPGFLPLDRENNRAILQSGFKDSGRFS
jgi:hypothetical protein